MDLITYLKGGFYMDGNPEGTPNPLNPMPENTGMGNPPQANEEAVTGTGTLDYTETVTPSTDVTANNNPSMPTNSGVNADAVNNTTSPNNTNPTPYTNHSVVDPMMRPVPRHTETTQNAGYATGYGMDATTATTAATATTTPVENFDTLGVDNSAASNSMENFEQPNESQDLVAKDSIVEPANKGGRKKAFVIGAIVLLMIAIICGAAAIVIFVINAQESPVTKAINKLINGEVSSIVNIQGTLATSNSGTPTNTMSAKSIDADFNGTFDMKSPVNEFKLGIDADFENGSNVSVNVDGVNTRDGSTYVKLSGVSSVLQLMSQSAMTTDNCNGNTNCTTGTTNTTADNLALTTAINEVANSLEDTWILLTSDASDSASSVIKLDESSTCLVSALGALPKSSSEIANKYKVNPFIIASTDNLEISKKKDTLYRLNIDKTKFDKFIDSIKGTQFVNELNACGTVVNTLGNDLANSPSIYAEIDGDNNFTRLFMKSTASEGNTTSSTKFDLSFSYPSKLEIIEPTEYVEASKIFSSMFGGTPVSSGTVIEGGTVTGGSVILEGGTR